MGNLGNKDIFKNNTDNNQQFAKQNQKFKLSGLNIFEIIFSFLLFVPFSLYYYFSYPNPQSLDELETCVGKMKLDIVFQRHSRIYEFSVLCNSNDIKQTKFYPASVNSFYGDIENWLESGKERYFKNANLLNGRTVKIWYLPERIIFKKINRAYQIQILDFDYEKNPNLKNGEYFAYFNNKQSALFFNTFLLIMMNSMFLIITIKILIKSRRKKCQA